MKERIPAFSRLLVCSLSFCFSLISSTHTHCIIFHLNWYSFSYLPGVRSSFSLFLCRLHCLVCVCPCLFVSILFICFGHLLFLTCVSFSPISKVSFFLHSCSLSSLGSARPLSLSVLCLHVVPCFSLVMSSSTSSSSKYSSPATPISYLLFCLLLPWLVGAFSNWSSGLAKPFQLNADSDSGKFKCHPFPLFSSLPWGDSCTYSIRLQQPSAGNRTLAAKRIEGLRTSTARSSLVAPGTSHRTLFARSCHRPGGGLDLCPCSSRSSMCLSESERGDCREFGKRCWTCFNLKTHRLCIRVDGLEWRLKDNKTLSPRIAIFQLLTLYRIRLFYYSVSKESLQMYLNLKNQSSKCCTTSDQANCKVAANSHRSLAAHAADMSLFLTYSILYIL